MTYNFGSAAYLGTRVNAA